MQNIEYSSARSPQWRHRQSPLKIYANRFEISRSSKGKLSDKTASSAALHTLLRVSNENESDSLLVISFRSTCVTIILYIGQIMQLDIQI